MAIRKDMTLSQKIEYIKDYYKWPILLTLLSVITLSVWICNEVTAEKYDANMIYAGLDYYGKEHQETINAMGEYITDIHGDGEKNILFDQFCYSGTYDPQYLATMTLTLEKTMAKGEIFLYLLDESRLSVVLSDCRDLLLPVSEWAEGNAYETVEKDGVAYAVKLANSEYLKAHNFPADDLFLVLCKGNEKNASLHENARDLARELIR